MKRTCKKRKPREITSKRLKQEKHERVNQQKQTTRRQASLKTQKYRGKNQAGSKRQKKRPESKEKSGRKKETKEASIIQSGDEKEKGRTTTPKILKQKGIRTKQTQETRIKASVQNPKVPMKRTRTEH